VITILKKITLCTGYEKSSAFKIKHETSRY
jgi:hypothetical protein